MLLWCLTAKFLSSTVNLSTVQPIFMFFLAAPSFEHSFLNICCAVTLFVYSFCNIRTIIYWQIQTSEASMNGVLPFTKEDLYFNKLPPTIVHLDTREVSVFIQLLIYSLIFIPVIIKLSGLCLWAESPKIYSKERRPSGWT